MATGLVDIIKRAAIDAVDNNQMCDLKSGTVVSVSPLKVQITNQFTIPASLLIIPQHLTKYKIKINGTESEIDNSLKTGDEVALIRKTGGKSYCILDRI